MTLSIAWGSMPPCLPRSSIARTGVATTPSMFDADAAQTAAGTLPPAMDVKAMED